MGGYRGGVSMQSDADTNQFANSLVCQTREASQSLFTRNSSDRGMDV